MSTLTVNREVSLSSNTLLHTAMGRIWFPVFFVLGLYSGYMVRSQGFDDISNECIGCICEAASHCNQTAGCIGNMCGLFKITWPYWADAGKHVIPLDDPESPEAWVRCVTDPYCAAETVKSYLTKFRQDCNQDGRIDCFDYAAIHHVGGYGCNSRPWDKKYEANFIDCHVHVQSLN